MPRSGIGLEEPAPRSAAVTKVTPAVFSTAAVVAIVASQGGYFPTSWGWSALALLAVVLHPEAGPVRQRLVTLAGRHVEVADQRAAPGE